MSGCFRIQISIAFVASGYPRRHSFGVFWLHPPSHKILTAIASRDWAIFQLCVSQGKALEARSEEAQLCYKTLNAPKWGQDGIIVHAFCQGSGFYQWPWQNHASGHADAARL